MVVNYSLSVDIYRAVSIYCTKQLFAQSDPSSKETARREIANYSFKLFLFANCGPFLCK